MGGSKCLLLHAVSDKADAERFPYYFVSKSQLKVLARLAASYGQVGKKIEISFDDGHESVASAIDLIRAVSEDIIIRVFIPTVILNKITKKSLNPALLRNLSNIRNVLIGSHGHYHRPLSLLSPSDLLEELEMSKSILEEILSCQVHSLSYPYGDVNRRVTASACSVGFYEGYSSFWGVNFAHTDCLRLNRVQVLGSETEALLTEKMSRAFYWRGVLQRIRYVRRLL